MKTKSALSYFGSDSEVAERLASLLDSCKHVTIPFCGGMSILPHLRARAIVANDLNDLAINFYRFASGVMGKEYQELLFERCEYTLSHPSELDDAAARMVDHPSWKHSWQQAWGYWAHCWIGRKGKGGTTVACGMPSVRRTASGGTNASRIKAAASDLRAWAKHFERCEWQCVGYDTLIPKVADSSDCGIYCDPPWFGAGEVYIHKFDGLDHALLERQLRDFQNARIVVRYGDCTEVRELYRNANWTITEATARTQANKQLGEVWITNFEVNN